MASVSFATSHRATEWPVGASSQRLEDCAQKRKDTMRPRTPMTWSTETCPELIRKNPPSIFRIDPFKDVPWKCESIPPPSTLKLTIRGQYGANYTVRVYPWETVAKVKAIIKDQGGVTPAAQRMYLPPLTLRDEDEVGSYEGIDSRVINVFEERD